MEKLLLFHPLEHQRADCQGIFQPDDDWESLVTGLSGFLSPRDAEGAFETAEKRAILKIEASPPLSKILGLKPRPSRAA